MQLPPSGTPGGGGLLSLAALGTTDRADEADWTDSSPSPTSHYWTDMVRFSGLVTLLVIPGSLGAQGGARATLFGADRELSAAVFANGPVATLPNALGADGVLVWPGSAVLQGSTAATAFFAHQPLLSATRMSWQPFRIEIAPDSSLAVLIGVATIDRPATDPVPMMHRIGRYLAVWKRVDGAWHLAAFAPVNMIAAGETIWTAAIGPVELPILNSTGPTGAFIAADSAFSVDAGATNLSAAFTKWAAPDAMTFAVSGELNVGPTRIGAALATNTAHRVWTVVAAGASSDGALGWTVGQSTITPAAGGPVSKTKYITLWRRQPDGSIRFIADGGSARP